MKQHAILVCGLVASFIMASCQASHTIRSKSLPKNLVESLHVKLLDEGEKTIDFLSLGQKRKATILFFFQRKCGCVKRYQARIQQLYERYASDGFNFIYVSSNGNESYKDVLAEFKKRKLKLPLFRDEGGHLARAVGAKTTPTSAIITPDGTLEFLGWIDNERKEHERGRIAYLESAILDIKNNHKVKLTTSPMFGCPIR